MSAIHVAALLTLSGLGMAVAAGESFALSAFGPHFMAELSCFAKESSGGSDMTAPSARATTEGRGQTVWGPSIAGIIAGGVIGATGTFGFALEYLTGNFAALCFWTFLGWMGGNVVGGAVGMLTGKLAGRLQGATR